MKKIVSLFIVFVYAVSVSGMVVQQRFCGNKLIDCGLAGTLDDCCKMEEMKDCKKNCCLEKSETIKVESAQEKPVSFKILRVTAPDLFSELFFISSFDISTDISNVSSVDIFPRKIPLRILLSNFRI